MLPQAFKDLLTSEKGFAGGFLVIAATVLFALGKLSVDQWVEYTQWIFVTYAAAKTTAGAVTTIWGKPAQPPVEQPPSNPTSP